MSLIIRSAVMEDAPAICTICQNALGYDCDLALVKEQLVRILSRESERVYVAWDEAAQCVTGFIHVADYETLFSGSMKNIIALAVAPSEQGLGTGRLLATAAENWARNCGCMAVRLESGVARTKAHEFYMHCGYRLRKEHKNFMKEMDV